MARYVGGRLVSGLLTLFLFVTILFFLVNILIPGDFVSQFILTEEGARGMRESLGLDRPLWEQYWIWIRGVFTLDLGESFGRGDVTEALKMAVPPTLLVLAVGLAVAFVLGGWMGRVAAYGNKSYFSGSITFVAILFLTMFPPVLGILLEQGLQGVVGYTATGAIGHANNELWDWDLIFLGEAISPEQVMWRMMGVLVVTLVVLVVIERIVFRVTRRRVPRWLFLIAMVSVPLLIWGAMGLSSRVVDIAGSLSLLLTGVVLLSFGDVLLVTRAAMADVMLEDYVMVARAKGLPEKTVRNKHAARTALLPVLSRFTVSIPYFLTGLVILEAAFSGAGIAGIGVLQQVITPRGLGSILFEAVADQDIPMIMGSLLVVGILTLLLRITLDVAHAMLDPRIRFGESDVR